MEINKIELRKAMRQMRNQLDYDKVQLNSKRIFDQILNHSIYMQSQCVFSYASFRNEVDTTDFHKRILSDGKTLALPKVLTKERMEFFKITDLNQLIKSSLGIFEPDETCEIVSPSNIHSLMILPGLAYDPYFNRLGYGGGYYDRYLEKYSKNIICCGVGFQCQMIEKVPTMPYDQLMDYIVTEEKWNERMDVK